MKHDGLTIQSVNGISPSKASPFLDLAPRMSRCCARDSSTLPPRFATAALMATFLGLWIWPNARPLSIQTKRHRINTAISSPACLTDEEISLLSPVHRTDEESRLS